MVTRNLLPAVCLAAAVIAHPSAQSDLDSLMAQVLNHRDENWKKLQQYTLTERERLQVTALAVVRVFGFEREYHWFPREGFFIRSPLTMNGVTIDEERRRREEDKWLRDMRNRERNQRDREQSADGGNSDPAERAAEPLGDLQLTGAVDDIISQTFEPEFVRSANFLRFKFDQGSYALAGRERMLERDVLKVEYYPKRLFKPESHGPCERRDKSQCDKENRADDDIDTRMNKVSLVTLWVDAATKQVLRYEFLMQDLDFLPGRSIVHVDGARATMQMGEPFADVWLPDSVTMRFRLTSALGPLEARYDVRYRDYRLPEVTSRIQ